MMKVLVENIERGTDPFMEAESMCFRLLTVDDDDGEDRVTIAAILKPTGRMVTVTKPFPFGTEQDISKYYSVSSTHRDKDKRIRGWVREVYGEPGNMATGIQFDEDLEIDSEE